MLVLQGRVAAHKIDVVRNAIHVLLQIFSGILNCQKPIKTGSWHSHV